MSQLHDSGNQVSLEFDAKAPLMNHGCFPHPLPVGGKQTHSVSALLAVMLLVAVAVWASGSQTSPEQHVALEKEVVTRTDTRMHTRMFMNFQSDFSTCRFFCVSIVKKKSMPRICLLLNKVRFVFALFFFWCQMCWSVGYSPFFLCDCSAGFERCRR